MNFVAHSHVTLDCDGATLEHAFGAALPDLASMAGTRVDKSLLDPRVAEGVALHHMADKAFHALERFRTGSAEIRNCLLEAGVGTGPARAVAHGGYELLLDGCVLERPGVPEEFAAVLAAGRQIDPAVTAGDGARWRELSASLEEQQWWLGYTDPEMVARALHRRLSHRRLLRFDAAEIGAVATVLASARSGVAADADEVLSAVGEALRAGNIST